MDEKWEGFLVWLFCGIPFMGIGFMIGFDLCLFLLRVEKSPLQVLMERIW